MDGTSSLYDDDFVAWTEEQAAALRELAARPDLYNALDWENVVEEIETLGRSEWKGVASHIRNALAHILKEICDPDSFSRQAWSVETNAALAEARDDFRKSMRPHLDIDAIWRKAFRQASEALEPYHVTIPPGIPERCPFTLDEVLDEAFNHKFAVLTLHRLLADLSTR